MMTGTTSRAAQVTALALLFASMVATACKGTDGTAGEGAGPAKAAAEQAAAEQAATEKAATEKAAAEQAAAARAANEKAAADKASPQVVKAEGIEWVVAPDLVGRLEVVRATCERRRTTRPCEVTLRLPRGSGAVGMDAAALHFDRDGARIGQKAIGPYIDGVEAGGAARVRISTLSADATKVVFTAR